MPDRDRDQSVEQWLRQTPLADARVDDCLDAEMLAAWAEGTLDGRQRTTAEAHAASCARCQAMLAVMVRTTPIASASSRSPVRRWLMLLGPAMAAAAAVALWVAVDRRREPSAIDELSKGQAKAERAAEVAQRAAPPGVGAEKEADARRELADRAGAGTEANARVVAAPGNEAADKKDLASAKRADTPLDAERMRAEARPAATPPPPAASSRPVESVQVAAESPPVVVAPPGPAPQQQANQALNQNQAQTQNQNQAQAPNQNQASPRQQAAGAAQERVVVTEPPLNRAASDSTAAGGGAGRGGVAGAFAGLRADAGAFDVAVPESSVRWRVVDGRTVQRSLDTGTTWAAHYAAENGVFLTAGSAPSATVCWLVGRSGAIVVTTDGRAWQPVTFPESIDLIAVAASNARAATVTTVDGRRFATTDGGRTWLRQ